MANTPQRPKKLLRKRPRLPVKKAGRGTVTKTVEETYRGDVLSREVIIAEFGDLQSVQNPAYIEAGCGHTIPRGDYASLRIWVQISMPCDPLDKDKMFDLVVADVAAKLEEELSK